MGSTNKTKIGLSQFIDTDKPTWLGDYNTDMETITQNIDVLQVATSSVAMGAITKLETTVTAIGDSVTANTNDIATLKNDVATNKASIDTVTADLNTLDTREQAHYDAIKGQYDTQNQTLDDLQKQQNHFELNMNKMESDVVVNTASIAKMQVKIADLETTSSTATSDITAIKTDIDNLQAETDTLDTTVRQHDSAIKKNQTDITSNTTSIGLLNNRLTDVEGLKDDMESVQDDISTLQTDMVTAKRDITANDNAIKAQQDITANIESGVDVPFGFGTTADGKRGYKKDDGTIEPFVTSEEYTDLQDDVTANMGDIATLTQKTANILDGASLPYSLGIADGGAYGYIKNGEQGVTPFVGQDEVDALVKVSPVVTDLKSDVEQLEIKSSNINGNFQTNTNYVATDGIALNSAYSGTVTDENRKTLVVGTSNTDKEVINVPFSFGVDINGNYGYIKAGADSVTPFLSPLNVVDNLTYAYASASKTANVRTSTLSYYVVPLKNIGILYAIKTTGSSLKLNRHEITDSNKDFVKKLASLFNVDEYFDGLDVMQNYLYFSMTDDSNPSKVPAILVDQNGNMTTL